MTTPKPDDFEHFCRILAEFSVERQEAFESCWNDGNVTMMVALIEEHVETMVK
jgi:hypothetical protein